MGVSLLWVQGICWLIAVREKSGPPREGSLCCGRVEIPTGGDVSPDLKVQYRGQVVSSNKSLGNQWICNGCAHRRDKEPGPLCHVRPDNELTNTPFQ